MRLFLKSLLCFLILSAIETSCSLWGGSDCDGSPTGSKYKIKDYSLSTYSGESQIATSTEKVSIRNIKFFISATTEFIVRLGIFSKPLYACSPVPPTPSQHITSIKITSNADLQLSNQILKAGENLNEIFVLNEQSNGGTLLTTYLQASNIEASGDSYALTIFKFISKNQTHQFTVDIVLSDNQKFSLSIPSVELTP